MGRVQPCDHAAHRLFGVVLHMVHVGQHHVEAEVLDHLAQLLHALFVGGYLRFQVGQVLLRVTRRIFATFQQRNRFGFAQHAAFDQQEVVDLHALFLDQRRKRRHGPGCDASDICMVTS